MIKFIRSIFILATIILFNFILSSCSTYFELFSFTPQDKTNTETQEETIDTAEKAPFTIAIYEGELLDPYTSQNRANRNIISLCYDGLVSVDKNLVAFGKLADYIIEENIITFNIKKDARFSDGTLVTAKDCVYSFNMASKSNSIFYNRIINYIDSWAAVSSDTFKVKLKSKNSFSINLFDIPIIKESNNSGSLYPLGSGRYGIKSINGKIFLEHYENALYLKDFGLPKIELLEISNPQDLNYNFNYGTIHAAYADLSDGTARYKGNIELVSFPASRLVFAVVNNAKPYFNNIIASKAFSYSINRLEISEQLFNKMSDPVWYPFNPNWAKIINANLNNDIYSTITANQLFNEAGLVLKGLNRSWKNEILTLSVICNNEDQTKIQVAKKIVLDLKALGFKAELTLYNWTNYMAAIKEGNFDIYIGNVIIPSNMDISFMLNPEICNNGIKYSEEFINALNAFYSEQIDVRTFVSSFYETMPFIPLYFTKGALAVNRYVSGYFLPSDSDIFNYIEFWEYSS